MTAVTLREVILRELEGLPEGRQADVLAFVRFLKIGLADEHTIESRFADALARARALAAERGITEADVAEEIRATRAGS
jgi:hypothetical protein